MPKMCSEGGRLADLLPRATCLDTPAHSHDPNQCHPITAMSQSGLLQFFWMVQGSLLYDEQTNADAG